MSLKGRTQLQTLEHDLVEMGARDAKTESGKQDLALGRLAAKARDAINNDFIRLTLVGLEEAPKKARVKKTKVKA